MEDNVIILRSVFKITDCWMEPSIDPATKRFPSVVRRTAANGDAILSEADVKSRVFFIKDTDAIRIYDGIRFDLNDEVDAAWWEAIKYSPKIARERGERDAKGNLVIDGDGKRYGTAEFYIERPGKESNNRVERLKQVHTAQAYVLGDSAHNLYVKAKLLGSRMDLAPVTDVQDFLLKKAEREPAEIIKLYTDENLGLRILMLDAKDRYVIVNKDSAIMYGDIILGYTVESALAFFKNPKNKRILDAIKEETYPEFRSQKQESNPFFNTPEAPTTNPFLDGGVQTPDNESSDESDSEAPKIVTLGKKGNTKK